MTSPPARHSTSGAWSRILEAKESGEEGLEKPQSIANAKGPWLAKRFKPLPSSQIDAAMQSSEA